MKRFAIFIIAATVMVGAIVAVRSGKGTVLPGRTVPEQSRAVYYCPMHPTYTADKPGDCPICNMKLVKREASALKGSDPKGSDPQEICVMHNCPMAHDGRPCPMQVVVTPGESVECPVCGTHVAGPEALEIHAPSGYSAVRISPERRQLIGIKTAVAEARSLTKTIRTVGRIAYDPELYQAEQEYLEALAAEGSEALAAAARTRLRLLGLNDELIGALVEQGGPDRRLLLTDTGGQAWLYATLYEFDLPWVAAGQIVTVEVPSAPDRPLTGVIRAVDPVLDPVTRSVRARALLDDPDGRLRPEMFVNVSVRVPVGDGVAVPAEAVFETGTRQIVFVDRGEGLLEPREVTVAVRAEGYAAVTAGVEAGERVVTNGNFLIDSESRLKAALDGMGQEGHQHGQ
ncbi:MAG: hypothetical protein A3C53_07730 [Omnitrophica WOR_2 bacterium RIFCSPHIGHO2_02_FULL_68_15]|nr:MAG: hypothetical protein A3C53_07730 [Omnitrophica WOR_2 bacterium RIFCSPHIGHO2_02_FULL_68_15]